MPASAAVGQTLQELSPLLRRHLPVLESPGNTKVPDSLTTLPTAWVNGAGKLSDLSEREELPSTNDRLPQRITSFGVTAPKLPPVHRPTFRRTCRGKRTIKLSKLIRLKSPHLPEFSRRNCRLKRTEPS